MKLKPLVAILVAAAGLFSMSAAQIRDVQTDPATPPKVQPRSVPQSQGAETRTNGPSLELNLTDQQKTQVQAVFEKMRQRIETAVLAARTNAETELKRILSPQQYQQLQNLLEAHNPHGEQPMGRSGGRESTTDQ